MPVPLKDATSHRELAPIAAKAITARAMTFLIHAPLDRTKIQPAILLVLRVL